MSESLHSTQRAPGISRATFLRLLLLLGPTVFLLTLIRLTEHTLLAVEGQPPILDVLRSNAPLPFMALLITLSLGIGLRSLRPQLRTGWLLTGTTLLCAGIFVLLHFIAPVWATGWVSAEAFQVVRWDLLTWLVLGLLSALLLDHLSGWRRTCYVATLHVLVLALMMLPVLELGSIMAMGTPLDWSLLQYTARHIHELAPVLASEIGPTQLSLLALPLLFIVAPPLIEHLRPIQAWMTAYPRQNHLRLRLLLPALPLLLLLILPPATPLPPTHGTIYYAGMVRSMLNDAPMSFDDLPPADALQERPFDAQTLRLVPTSKTKRMNVVVILLESFRSRSITPYNPELPTTPFLDSLAQHALLVEQMYSIISYTNKSLVPTLAGIYPELSREIVEAEPDRVPAVGLPSLLKPHGYRTAFFTPATMSFERKDVILQNIGFDTIRGDGDYPTEGFHKTSYFGHEDQIMLGPSMAWVDEATASGEPFLMTYLTLTSHHDYALPPSFEHQTYVAHDETLNDYLNALRYTDTFIADLFQAFEERSLLDSTLFVLLGDHGEAFGEHGVHMHGEFVWDESLHTPALIYNPHLIPEKSRIDGNRSPLDIVPTIADALGYQIEGGSLPGSSLLQPVPEDRLLYHSARNSNKVLALRQDSLKFLYYHRRQPMQVYDIQNDPFEQHNIVDQIAPEHLKSVEWKLLLWRRGVQQLYHQEPLPSKQLATR